MPLPKVALPALLVALASSGCVLSGGGLEDAAVDRTATTSAVQPATAQAAPAVAAFDRSDENTVRNAVSSANLRDTETQPMAWANADTGASGVISSIRERRAGDVICRQFRTSRQRFDGVALYDGEACTKGRGEWTLTRFNEGG